MKCKLLKSHLAGVLSAATGSVVAKTLPVAQAALLNVEGGELTITADDGDTRVSIRTPVADVEEEGAVLVHGKRLTDIVKAVPSDAVTLEGGQNLTVSGGGWRTLIKGFELADRIPDRSVVNTQSFEVKQTHLKAALKGACVPAHQAFSDNRADLAGVRFRISGGVLYVAGADGRRLAESTVPCSAKLQDAGVTIPVHSAEAVEKILGDAGEVGVFIGESMCMFITDTTTIKTPVLEANYPEYQRVIPDPAKSRFLTIDRRALIEAATRAMMAMDHRFPRIDLTTDKKTITISSASSDGDSKEALNIQNGYETHVILHPRYLIESLKPVESETVDISIEGTVFIKSGDYRAVIMPMTPKTNDEPTA